MKWTPADAQMADKFCKYIEGATITLTVKEHLEFHRCLAWFNKILLDLEAAVTEKPPVARQDEPLAAPVEETLPNGNKQHRSGKK